METDCASHCLWVMLVCLFAFPSSAEATWTFFMNRTETNRLLGVPAEVYYVRNGTVNEYALTFNLPLKTPVKDIYFDWISTHKQEPYYRISLSTSNPSAIESPALSIAHSGRIPSQLSTFSIRLPCTGLISSEVDIRIQLNITSPVTSNMTTIDLRRRKTCLIGNSQLTKDGSEEEEDGREGGQDDVFVYDSTSEPDQPTTSNSALLTVVGCTVGVVLVVALLTVVFYNAMKTRRPIGYHLSQSNCARITTKDKNCNKSTSASCTRSLLSTGSPLRPVSPFNSIAPPGGGGGGEGGSGSSVIAKGSQVSLIRLIMEGSIGRVYYAVLQSEGGEIQQPVLVKTTKVEMSDAELQRMMSEVYSLKGCFHANIRPMFACILEHLHQPLIVYPFTSDCNLKIYLRTCRASQVLTTVQLVQMTFGICSGLCYLHSRLLLHKDVATRNCLMDDSLTVRLTDSALTPDFFPEDYQNFGGHSEPVPVRWLPLETLSNGVYQAPSEVWSFGVTLWEVMTLGQQPYPEIDSGQLLQHLHSGHRLHHPANCPTELCSLMSSCWESAPETRPNVLQLYTCIERLYVDLGEFI